MSKDPKDPKNQLQPDEPGKPCRWSGGNDYMMCWECGLEYDHTQVPRPPCPRMETISENNELLTFLELAGRGCISGSVSEWPQLKPACKWAADRIAELEATIAKLPHDGEGNPLAPGMVRSTADGVRVVIESIFTGGLGLVHVGQHPDDGSDCWEEHAHDLRSIPEADEAATKEAT